MKEEDTLLRIPSFMFIRILFFLLTFLPLHAEVRTVWQTVHDYNTTVEPLNDEMQDRQRVNPFLSYTHIGTDYGFIGPNEGNLGWRKGQISMKLGYCLNDWAGMWHSLARLARMPSETMNFSACYPKAITKKFQPKVTAIRLVSRGIGKIKIDLSDSANHSLWMSVIEINSKEFHDYVIEVPYETLQNVKMLNWIGEPGTVADIDRLDLRISTPDISFEDWVFLASYVKALTCYSPSTSFMRDRAHADDGTFDSVPATGLFCTATCAAADMGIVEKTFAHDVVEHAVQASVSLRGPSGLLPHFILRDEKGLLHKLPNTEYSTIDTSIFYFGALIAAKMLNDEQLVQLITAEIKKVNFKPLISEKGFISHGYMPDDKTIIPYHWSDWGGESALVILLQRMCDPTLRTIMNNTAHPYNGTGFIVEIASLYFSDFDNDKPDALTKVSWKLVRQQMLKAQKEYALRQQAIAKNRDSGAYGLSAGEQRNGLGYAVSGVDLANQMLVHPHYILMSASTDPDPSAVLATLRKMENAGYFTPLGMVENISLTDGEPLPMLGSLNACFEAIGAYHFTKKISSHADEIYNAANAITGIREAMKVFYP